MKLLKLIEIADLVANSIDFEAVTSGCIDTSATQTIGVYQRDATEIRECIGGEESLERYHIGIFISRNMVQQCVFGCMERHKERVLRSGQVLQRCLGRYHIGVQPCDGLVQGQIFRSLAGGQKCILSRW